MLSLRIQIRYSTIADQYSTILRLDLVLHIRMALDVRPDNPNIPPYTQAFKTPRNTEKNMTNIL